MAKENIDVYLNKPGRGSGVKKYNFKQFKAKGSFREAVPCISISESGFIFNVHCHDYFYKKPYALIFWDKERKAVAIMPTQEKLTSSYKVCGSSGTMKVASHRFIKENLKGFLQGKTKRVFPIWDEKNKMFILDLKGK